MGKPDLLLLDTGHAHMVYYKTFASDTGEAKQQLQSVQNIGVKSYG
jgi:hypothetical protein